MSQEELFLVEQLCDEFEGQWRDGGRPSIDDYLQRISESHRDHFFRELLEIEIEYRRDRGEESLEAEFLLRYPQHQILISDCFNQTAGDESQLQSDTTLNGPHSDSSTKTRSLGSFGDYELLEEIARGGMGVVYKARQISLNRIVAVKMILSGQLAGEEEVHRFHAEAEAAANLNHPHIVAVHEVGRHDGHHFFSMDYVEGQSLAQIVQEHPLPATKAAEYLIAIAEAMHVAHTHGILHRDLKPSNILIDQSDRPQITDFGLAKRIETDSQLTASGTVLGTPSYMPPEQVSSQSELIGPSSDVYSLGGILYELITGRPPFQAATLMDTLSQVLETEPASPRLLNPKLPRDLETICLKCLHKEPSRRYASAQELANDLKHFLADEPIHARRISIWERGLKWTRRRPALSGLLAVSVVAVFVVTFLAVRQWRISAQRLAIQRELQKKNRDNERLRQRFVDTGKRVEQFVELSSYLPERKRLEQLNTALMLYDDLLVEVQGNSALRQETARSHKLISDVYQRLGNLSEAEKADRHALQLREELMLESTSNTEYAADLARSHTGLGGILKEQQRYQESREHHLKALSIFQKLANDNARDRDYGNGIATVSYNMGNLHLSEKRYRDAQSWFHKALDQWEEIGEPATKKSRYWHDLSACQLSLGTALRNQDQSEAAMAAYSKALQLKLKVDDLKIKKSFSFQIELARIHNSLGDAHRKLKQMPQALSAYREAQKVYLDTVRQFPAVTECLSDLAENHDRLAVLLLESGKLDEARQEQRRRNEIHKQLVADHRVNLADIKGPLENVPAHRQYLVKGASRQAEFARRLQESGQLKEASLIFRDAIMLYGELVESLPQEAGIRNNLANTHIDLGIVLRKLGQTDDALAQQQRGRILSQELVNEFTGNASFQSMLAHANHSLGESCMAVTKYREAEDALLESKSTYDDLSKRHPANAQYRRNLAVVFHNLGRLYQRTARLKEAKAAYESAIKIRQVLVRDYPDSRQDRRSLAAYFINLAKLLDPKLKEKHYLEAIAILGKLTKEYPHYPDYQHDLAAGLNDLGWLQYLLKRNDEAEANYLAAIPIQQRIVENHPEVALYHADHGCTLDNLAIILLQRGELEKARALLDDAVKHQKIARKSNPRNATYRRFLNSHYKEQAEVFLALKQPQEAGKAAEEMLALYAGRSDQQYLAANFLARCVELILQDAQLPDSERETSAKRYTIRIIQLLGSAIADDPKRLAQLNKAKAFDALRKRSEFAEFLSRLKQRSSPDKGKNGAQRP